VFCDFDGSITEADTFIGMFRHLDETKDIVEGVLDQIHNKEIAIKKGIFR
jgi:2-hydroxy-3-keto-5-methylthiopentenyl-1-phosphate phosphatase